MTSGLHVHNISMEMGTLTATLGDLTGRHICIEVRPEDNEALDAAYNRLCEVIVAAASSVMLELLDMHGDSIAAAVPEVPEEPAMMTVPCRICGDLVEVEPFPEDQRGHMMAKTRCAEHRVT